MSHYTIQDDIADYWEARYQQWLVDPNWDIYRAKDEWFETRLAHLLPPVAGQGGRFPIGSCLDYGCGNAMFAVPLLRRFEAYDGFDSSRTALEIARRYYSQHRPELSRRMEITHYAGEPGQWGAPQHHRGTYDLVMSITVLQHQPLAYRLAMITDIKRLLRPKGMYLGLEWIGGTQAYDMPPMDEEVWRAAWWPWELTFDRHPGHPEWWSDNVWTAKLP